MDRNRLVDADGATFALIGAQSMSCGLGMQTDSRYAYDASRGPQGIFRRARESAATCTIQCVISPQICAESSKGVFGYVADVEALVGRNFSLYWVGQSEGEWIVTAAQFSGTVDPLVGLSDVSISLSLVQARVGNPQPQTAVRRRTEVSTL